PPLAAAVAALRPRLARHRARRALDLHGAGVPPRRDRGGRRDRPRPLPAQDGRLGADRRGARAGRSAAGASWGARLGHRLERGLLGARPRAVSGPAVRRRQASTTVATSSTTTTTSRIH